MSKKLLVIFSLALALMLTGCSGGGATVYDKDSNEMGTLDNYEKSEYASYLEVVYNEVVGIIKAQEKCTDEEAAALISDGKYQIYTAFDENVHYAIQGVYGQLEDTELTFGSAVTDLKGHLLATFSSSSDTNYAVELTSPYSSIKPLSVYTPALESGDSYWSKMYEDSPVKKVDGQDWPANSTGKYLMTDITVADAVKDSVNTVAVKCLNEYGVKNSLKYMEETFGLALDFEKQKADAMGEGEVVGNIALGYLQEGVSPVQMAGYYQSFANGGFYAAPAAVLKICDTEGKIIYHAEGDMERVISPEAAYVMNQILQGVVKDGTGTAARIDGIEIGGKTGTGPDGNWFVGFTPEYSCAVWHGAGTDSNYAAQIFAAVAGGWTHNTDVDYPESGTVKEEIYCSESGKLFSSGCTKFDRGYYLSVKCPDNCDKH